MQVRARRGVAGVLLAAVVLAACGDDDDEGAGAGSGEVVTVYTGRHYGIEPVFERFTEETGIDVRFTTGRDPELRERLEAEGDNTPADLYMTADAANLGLAADAGLLQPAGSEALEELVPAEIRDPEGRWFALSRRPRTVVYDPEDVEAGQITDYADLADPAWQGRLCLRPATHPYVQSLVASLIGKLGPERAREVVQGWVDNDPQYIDSDVEIVKNVAADVCDVAIVNSYYLARLTDSGEAGDVALAWVEADGQGPHINISGAGITAHAPNPDGARRLLEWLAEDGQQQFADANFEFPATSSGEPHPILAAWDPLPEDELPAHELSRTHAQALELLDEVGYL